MFWGVRHRMQALTCSVFVQTGPRASRNIWQVRKRSFNDFSHRHSTLTEPFGLQHSLRWKLAAGSVLHVNITILKTIFIRRSRPKAQHVRF